MMRARFASELASLLAAAVLPLLLEARRLRGGSRYVPGKGRTFEVGGNQGRGNPPAVPRVRLRRGAPDALTLAIAAHVIETTWDAAIGGRFRWRLNASNPAAAHIAQRWHRLGEHLRAWREVAEQYAAARPWRPWWPGARVACGCGDCRAYALGRPEGVSVGGQHYPSQPASWWRAGRPVESRRPKLAA